MSVLGKLNKILHIEDDPDILEISLMALEAIGEFTVAQCSTGKEGLTKAPQFLPDLILLDVMMPGMNGPETLEALRQLPETENTPIIFMTAKVQPREVEKYLLQGAVAVITKPFDPITLSDQLIKVWNDIS